MLCACEPDEHGSRRRAVRPRRAVVAGVRGLPHGVRTRRASMSQQPAPIRDLPAVGRHDRTVARVALTSQEWRRGPRRPRRYVASRPSSRSRPADVRRVAVGDRQRAPTAASCATCTAPKPALIPDSTASSRHRRASSVSWAACRSHRTALVPPARRRPQVAIAAASRLNSVRRSEPGPGARLDAHRLVARRRCGRSCRRALRHRCARRSRRSSGPTTVLAGLEDHDGEAESDDAGRDRRGVRRLDADASTARPPTTRALEIWQHWRCVAACSAASAKGRRAERPRRPRLPRLADHASARVSASRRRALNRHRAGGRSCAVGGPDRSRASDGSLRGGGAARGHRLMSSRRPAFSTARSRRSGRRVDRARTISGRAYLDLGEVSQAPRRRFSAGAGPSVRPIATPRGAAQRPHPDGTRLPRGGGVAAGPFDAPQRAQALAQRASDARAEITTLVNLGSALHSRSATSAEGHPPASSRARPAPAAIWLSRRREPTRCSGSASAPRRWTAEPARSRDYLQQAIAIQTAIKDVRGQCDHAAPAGGGPARARRRAAGAPASINRSVSRINRPRGRAGLTYSGSLTLANVYAAPATRRARRRSYEEALARLRDDPRPQRRSGLAPARYGRFQAGQGRYAGARRALLHARPSRSSESLRALIVDPRSAHDLRHHARPAPYRLYADVLMEMGRPVAHRRGLQPPKRIATRTNSARRARPAVRLLAAAGVDIREGVDPALVDRERSLRWNLQSQGGDPETPLPRRHAPRRTPLSTLER